MAHPVVHFEILGQDPQRLRAFYGELFGWRFDTSAEVPVEVSAPTEYGFVERPETGDDPGIPGGVGGGPGYPRRVTFYVGVPDVAEALRRAESLGGARVIGPARAPSGLVVGHFSDPEGNVVGVAAA